MASLSFPAGARAVTGLLVVCLLSVLPVADAPAAAKPRGKPRLAVVKLADPRASATAGSVIRVRGAIRNLGLRPSRAGGPGALRIQLRGPGIGRRTIRRAGIRRVKPGRTRRFSIRVRVPRSLAPAARQGPRGPFRLVACIRTRGGGGGLRCRRAAGGLRVLGRASPSLPTPLPVPAPVPPPATGFTPGARTLNDPLFPQIGNGGYDALSYLIDLDYDPAVNAFLPGTRTVVTAKATQDLSQFSLDFQDELPVSAVSVNGVVAAFEQVAATPRFSDNPAVTQPEKLVVTPPMGIPSGMTFSVEVAYAGTPVEITDADESIEGWVRACQVPQADTGCDGSFTVNEPIGAQSWFPSNNYAADKATFETRLTVPGTHVALGVGELASRVDNGDGSATWTWAEDDPTATYLTSATVGEFDYSDTNTITETSTGAILPLYTAIDSAKLPIATTEFASRVGLIEPMTNFLSGYYGPYPFDSTGAIADIAPDVNYALENQTKPHFAGNAASSGVAVSTLLHELAHQWMGDSVSGATWEEIWFNEGWATFSEELYAANADPAQGEAFFDEVYATPDDQWTTPPAHVGSPANLFAEFPVYQRPAGMLEGFREIVGDDVFFAFARDLQETYGHGVISLEQFITTAKQGSGLGVAEIALLDEYFRQWLLGNSKPALTPDDFPAP